MDVIPYISFFFLIIIPYICINHMVCYSIESWWYTFCYMSNLLFIPPKKKQKVYRMKCITANCKKNCNCGSWLLMSYHESNESAKSNAKLTTRIIIHWKIVCTYPGKFRSTRPLTHISLITALWHKMISKEKESKLKDT